MYNINLSTAVAIKGEDVYFSALYHNALFKMNMRTRKTEYLCSFEKEKQIIGIHGRAFCYQESVWFIPQYGEYIACYNISRNIMEYFDIPGKIYNRPCLKKYCLNDCGEHIEPKYSDSGWIDEENIFLVSAGKDSAAILNLKTKKISRISKNINSANEFLGCGTYYEGKIWMAPYEGNQLVSLDIHTGEIHRIGCERELGTYYGICGYRGRIWFSSVTEKGVLFYDIYKQNYGVLPFENIGFARGKRPYRDIVEYNNTLWMIPYEAEKIIYLDNEKERFVEYNCKMKEKLGVMIAVDDIKNEFMYVISDTYHYLICLHKDSADYEIYTPQIRVSQLYDFLHCIYDEPALSMLARRYREGMSERDLGIKDYISLFVFQGFAENRKSKAEVKTKSPIGKTGQACFVAVKEIWRRDFV